LFESETTTYHSDKQKQMRDLADRAGSIDRTPEFAWVVVVGSSVG
jgi:hypothetical protein